MQNTNLITKAPNLNRQDITKDLVANHRILFKNFIAKQLYLKFSDRKLILDYYKRIISVKNILDYYQHPIQRFAQHLIDGNLNELKNNTSFLNRKTISTIKSQKS